MERRIFYFLDPTLRAQIEIPGGGLMQIEMKTCDEGVELLLQGNADVSVAQQFHRQIADAIATSKKVTIDCNALDYLDVACSQILIAVQQLTDVSVAVRLNEQSGVGQCLKTAGLYACMQMAPANQASRS